MSQRNERLIAALCCIWLLTVAALVSGQETPYMQSVRRAAEQGDATAQYELGLTYASGEGVPQNHEEAARWYQRTAEQGHAAAQSNLGGLNYHGLGVPQNYEEALRWYRLAAEQNEASAHYGLGVMYTYGHGVPQDYVEAHMWANLAGADGFEEARKLRDFLAQRMSARQVAAAHRAARKWRRARRQARTRRAATGRSDPDRVSGPWLRRRRHRFLGRLRHACTRLGRRRRNRQPNVRRSSATCTSSRTLVPTWRRTGARRRARLTSTSCRAFTERPDQAGREFEGRRP